jgi:nicotinamide mononucleotide adenylyltransferase
VRLACVTGRFQPVHAQHLELFALALAGHDHLVVGVTNPDTGARHEESTSAHRHTAAANPFTFFERVRLLDAALAGAGLTGHATVVPFDLTRPALWAQYVPLDAHQVVRAYSPWEKDKAARLAEGGYAVTVLDGAPTGKIDATDIRALLAGPEDAWADAVPPATVPILRALLAERPIATR